MSTAIYQAMAAGMNELNTALTDAFALDGTKCYLLKRAQDSDDWEETEITSGFFWDRDSDEFSFATTSPTFRKTFRESTHIAYGVEKFDESDQSIGYEVFEMQDEQKDYTNADAGSPFYVVTGLLMIKEMFTP
jgi:hypothetical protein